MDAYAFLIHTSTSTCIAYAAPQSLALHIKPVYKQIDSLHIVNRRVIRQQGGCASAHPIHTGHLCARAMETLGHKLSASGIHATAVRSVRRVPLTQVQIAAGFHFS